MCAVINIVTPILIGIMTVMSGTGVHSCNTSTAVGFACEDEDVKLSCPRGSVVRDYKRCDVCRSREGGDLHSCKEMETWPGYFPGVERSKCIWRKKSCLESASRAAKKPGACERGFYSVFYDLECVNKSLVHELCKNDTVSIDGEGYIMSPGYPRAVQACLWASTNCSTNIIFGNWQKKFVKVTFINLELSNKQHLYLTYKNKGTTNTVHVRGPVSPVDNNRPGNASFVARELSVHFSHSSKHGDTSQGFLLHITVQDDILDSTVPAVSDAATDPTVPAVSDAVTDTKQGCKQTVLVILVAICMLLGS